MKPVRSTIVLALVLPAQVAYADDLSSESAKSAAARVAFAKRDIAIKKALAAYRAALLDADKQLVVDVDSALRRPGVSKDPDANAELIAAKRGALDRLKETKSAGNEAEFPIVSATYGSLE